MKVNTRTLFAKAAKIALVAALASSLALVGCKSDDDDDDDPVLTSIVAGGTFGSFIEGGAFKTDGVHVYARYDNASTGYSDMVGKSTSKEVTDKATYTANDASKTVLEVDKTISLAAGTYTITVTYDGKTASEKLSLTVKSANIPVIGVKIADATVEVGAETTLTPTFEPADASNTKVSWSSDKTDIATVADGVVTGVAAGTATITVTTADGGKTATCTVTVTKPVTWKSVYSEDFSNVTTDTVTNVANLRNLSAGEDKQVNILEENGNKYLSVALLASDNDRAINLNKVTSAATGIYRVKFSAALTSGSSYAHRTQIALVNGFPGGSSANNPQEDFIFSLDCNLDSTDDGAGTKTWFINKSGTSVELDAGAWYNFTVLVNTDTKKVTVSIVDANGAAVLEAKEFDAAENAVMEAKGIHIRNGRYSSKTLIDNIVVETPEE